MFAMGTVVMAKSSGAATAAALRMRTEVPAASAAEQQGNKLNTCSLAPHPLNTLFVDTSVRCVCVCPQTQM